MERELSESSQNYSYYSGKIILPQIKRLPSRSIFHETDSNSTLLNQEESVIVRNKTSSFTTPNTVVVAPLDQVKPDNCVVLHHPNQLKLLEKVKINKKNKTTHPMDKKTHRKKKRLSNNDNSSRIKENTSLSLPHNVNGLLGDEAILSKSKSDENLIGLYKDYINKRYNKELGNSTSFNNDNGNISNGSSDFSVSSLLGTSSDESADTGILPEIKLKPNLYKKQSSSLLNHKQLENVVVTKANLMENEENRTLSLPDLRALNNVMIKKVSHVSKNESEAESEPGAQRGYKFCPLPSISSKSTSLPKRNDQDNATPSKIIDHFQEKKKHKSFKEMANIVTLIPRLTTNSVRSRKLDHHLADLTRYLPDKKLKIFIGTWNMKGTKSLPNVLDDFLLPKESVYLQDVYVIGTQEGTPFKREWQMRLQEAFGPSYVLMRASNFGVLQMSVFVRRELVWFCSDITEDTIATRVVHKIKTKGALAMCFNIFGTSLLFLTSHFSPHNNRVEDRINDYLTTCESISLGNQDVEAGGTNSDVTARFDRVFWFGDFNFRVNKPRDFVDKMLHKYSANRRLFVKKLLKYDQLSELMQARKIFRSFNEAPIVFMPTYKFDENTDDYDTSSKKRIPSWTDRVVYRSASSDVITPLFYNSCDTIKVSDHRPVYGIFEATIDAYKSKFTVPGAQFDREIYVEANLRRNAPTGNQESSHVCTIL